MNDWLVIYYERKMYNYVLSVLNIFCQKIFFFAYSNKKYDR